MTVELSTRLNLLKASVNRITRERYGADDSPDIERKAAQAGDTVYFQARLRLLEVERDASTMHLVWMSPTCKGTSKEALLRVKALCHYWPDLYEAMQAVLATHPLIARDILALAIKKFCRDTDPYTTEDVTSLLISAWNGGRHGFDAVLRTRKSAERKPEAVPWSRGDE